jgi:hypothetical protein
MDWMVEIGWKFGIVTSNINISGFNSFNEDNKDGPSSASPTTLIEGKFSIALRMPERTIA